MKKTPTTIKELFTAYLERDPGHLTDLMFVFEPTGAEVVIMEPEPIEYGPDDEMMFAGEVPCSP